MTAAATLEVAHNRFPVTVTPPGGTSFPGARLVITCPTADRPAELFVWTARGEPREHAAIDLAESTIGPTRRTWDLVTDLGVYRVEPGRGCGCSNPLKTWEPWTPMLMGSPSCLRP